MNDLFSLQGKTAIVTGGGRGIGRAICLAFAEAGADVAVASLVPSDDEATAKQVEAVGRRGLAVPTDISNEGQVGLLIQQALATFGHLDILVNNAGYNVAADNQWDVAEDVWTAQLKTNLTGAFLCTREFTRAVLADGGKGAIINIASIAGLTISPASAAYGASKAGLINFTKSMAVALGPHIRVNAIAPGFTETEMSRTALAGTRMWEESAKWSSLGRHAQPEDMANAAVFLACKASDFITGHTLVVDGGVSCKYWS